MNTEKNMKEHKRGSICTLDCRIVRGKTKDERMQLSALRRNNPSFYLVMKILDDEQCLIVQIFKNHVKHTKKICIERETYWVRFSEFFVASKRLLVVEDKNQLKNPYEIVSAVYDSHKRYLKEKRKAAEKKRTLDEYWKKVLRESERNRDEYYRMKAPREEICVPEYISENAKYPFRGGMVSPR